MRRQLFKSQLIVLLGAMAAAGVARSALADTPASACSLSIVEPRTGERHGGGVLVSGKASVPADRFLWTFSHRRGLAVWWPQGGGPATINDGEYAVLTTLGQPQDVGAEFEIRVQIVDAAESEKLNAWFKRGDATGRYDGIPLPPAAEGAAPRHA